MSLLPNQLELLAPAKTAEIGREAILHGADAVYIGGPAFGARHNAGNSISDLAGLVEFAQPYHVRIFATLNTILHETELESARKQIWELYDAGVDALIIQDMGLLMMDLPPIELHASTQCDIRSPEKARFLADCGFSQLVLARELSIPDIQAISTHVAGTDTALEYFIHGALCVAFSGQCYISHAQTGRSANRGDCSQTCRLPFTLTDQDGGVVAYEKHLLSMKDNNQSDNLLALIKAGIRSFKIEGRYKEAPYVKNITAHYRQLLDGILEQRSDLAPASSGKCTYTFSPNPEKTFHRGSTDYFATGRKEDIGAFDSPTFVGLPLGVVTRITDDALEIATSEPMSNGDGLNYTHKRTVFGLQANVVKLLGTDADGLQQWRITPNEPLHTLTGLKVGIPVNRNRDHAWELALLKKSADRRIPVHLTLKDKRPNQITLSIHDREGNIGRANIEHPLTSANDTNEAAAQKLRQGLAKLGNTQFVAINGVADIELLLEVPWFIPPSVLNALRREAVENLAQARLKNWPQPQRKPAIAPPVPCPETSLAYLANIYNSSAKQFYEQHGVQLIDLAYEAHQESGEVSLMITKHCLRYSFNLCPKQAKGIQGVMGQVRADPMTLINGKDKLTLRFDCRACEMHVLGKIRKSVLQLPPTTHTPPPKEAMIQFYRK
ncbi:MAG: hypothetical protein RIR18_1165 [Pseudomonadota bacterium]|jgi:putative protease